MSFGDLGSFCLHFFSFGCNPNSANGFTSTFVLSFGDFGDFGGFCFGSFLCFSSFFVLSGTKPNCARGLISGWVISFGSGRDFCFFTLCLLNIILGTRLSREFSLEALGRGGGGLDLGGSSGGKL